MDHWCYFGDGNAAQIIDSRNFVKATTGKKYVKFILLPSRRIEETYDIETEQDRSGVLVREYPEVDVIFLERGVYRTRCWILTDFNGGDTIASLRTKALTEALKDTELLLRSAEAAKNRAYYELRMEREQKLQSVKNQSDIIREVARARAKFDQEGEEIDPNLGGGMGGQGG